MACYAKVGITGRLAREPKQSTVNSTTVINFGVAVYTTKKENDKYVADFYNVNYWGKAAENVLSKLKKGTPVQVYGDLTMDEYVDKSGNKAKNPSIRANEVIVLDVVFGNNAAQKEDNKQPEGLPF